MAGIVESERPENEKGRNLRRIRLLKAIRADLGLTQAEMGEALGGIKQGAYSNYENNIRPVPEGLTEQAFALLQERKGAAWVAQAGTVDAYLEEKAKPIAVPPGTIGGQGWTQSPEERVTASAQRAAELEAVPPDLIEEAVAIVEEAPELRALPKEYRGKAVKVVTQLLAMERAKGQAGWVRANLGTLLELGALGALQSPGTSDQ